jgi:hypothetical protein
MARQLDLLDYRFWVVEDREASQRRIVSFGGTGALCNYGNVEPQLNLTLAIMRS